MPAIHMTKEIINALTPPAKGRARYRDAGARAQPGLVLIHWAGGALVWYVYKKINGSPVERKVGTWPEVSVEQARRMAGEMLPAMRRGESVGAITGRRARAQTFGDLFAWWLTTHARPRLRSAGSLESLYRFHLEGPLGRRPIADVSRAELRELHANITRDAAAKRKGGTGQSAANRALSLVRAVYGVAIRAGVHEGNNPAAAVDFFPKPQRERRLAGDEATRFLEAVAQAPQDTQDFILLLLFTAARRSNVEAMAWADLDLTAGTWRIPRTKTGRPLLLPLEAAELAILARRQAVAASPWVFPSTRLHGAHIGRMKHSWQVITKRAGLVDFRLHDLRRTLGSYMADTGASMPVIGRLLGHADQRSTAIYARLQLDPVREAKRRAIAAMQGDGAT